jgi:hypothetical protein
VLIMSVACFGTEVASLLGLRLAAIGCLSRTVHFGKKMNLRVSAFKA